MSTAFSTSPLGIMSLQAWGNIPNLTADHLHEFTKNNFFANRMTLSGASVAHDRFMENAGNFFVRENISP